MTFIRYQHLERFGTAPVEGIEYGTTWVFPKLDGTNGSLWVGNGGHLLAGSRNRILAIEHDNAGFYNWFLKDQEAENYRRLVADHPHLVFYGEWLVPHSLTTYRDDAWRKFYIFDVYNRQTEEYLHYDDYANMLRSYKVEWLAPLAILNNGNLQDFLYCLERNSYLIKDGCGVGEGIVVKNYNWRNKFNNYTSAKIVTNAFKEEHHKAMGAPIIGGVVLEETIAKEWVTKALVDKVVAKITNEEEWNSKKIPKLLGIVWYDFITEEIFDVLKVYKNPTLNFGVLQRYVIQETKRKLPEIFGG